MKLIEMLYKIGDDDKNFRPTKMSQELKFHLGDFDSDILAGIDAAFSAIHKYGIPDDLDELMEVI